MRLQYADDQQKRELDRLPHYKKLKAKISSKPMDYRKLLDVLDEKLHRNSTVKISEKKLLKKSLRNFILFFTYS